MIRNLLSGKSGNQLRRVFLIIAAVFLFGLTTNAHAQSELPTTWRDDYFPQFHITIKPEDLTAILAAGSTARVPITFEYQGQTFTGTIRQRLGNSSLCGDKRQFRLDFPKKVTFPDGYIADRFETDRGNCYTLHEWAAWKLMDQAAQKRPDLKVLRKKYNVVAIYFNGELYHVQTLLEDVNKDLLEPQLGTRNFTIYENGCYGRDPSDLKGFCSTFSPAQMHEYLQIPSFLYSAAVVQMMGGYDNYPSYPFNYNFVQETATNRVWFMADDMDATIDSYGGSQSNPFQTIYAEGDSQRHFTELMNDPDARALYRSYLRELLPLFNPDVLKPLIAAKYEQVRETLMKSPELPLGTDWYDYVYLYEIPTWADARYAFLNLAIDSDGNVNRLPSAVIASLPASLEAKDMDGIIVQLNGTASTDPDNDNLTYVWKVDDVEIGTGATQEVKLAIGAHVITLSVNDGRGGNAIATANIEILAPSSGNKPPTAVIAPLPASIQANESDGVIVQLNGSASTDPDNDSLTYRWDINGKDVGTSTVLEIKLGIGAHVITLLVNDGRGGNATATANIEILPPIATNKPPTAVIAPLPASIQANEANGVQVQLNGSASSDPDNDNLTYRWNVDGQDVGESAVIELKLAIGAHTISLVVNDGRGGSGTATTTIEVLPPPAAVAPTITSVSPSRVSRDSAVVISINGTGFSPQANVYVSGSGVSVLTHYSSSETHISAYLRVQSFATPGARDVIIVNPDGQTAVLRGALTVQF